MVEIIVGLRTADVVADVVTLCIQAMMAEGQTNSEHTGV